MKNPEEKRKRRGIHLVLVLSPIRWLNLEEVGHKKFKKRNEKYLFVKQKYIFNYFYDTSNWVKTLHMCRDAQTAVITRRAPIY